MLALAPRVVAKTLPARACLECGDDFAPVQATATFCCSSCRLDFANRRMQRGAALYDLYMAFRYERTLARALNVMAAMNRLASVWRAEDRGRRAGRKSWQAPEGVFARFPFLKVQVVR